MRIQRKQWSVSKQVKRDDKRQGVVTYRLAEFIVNVMHIYAAFKVMNLKVRNYIEKVYS